MCLSPHVMTTAEIEYEISGLRRLLDDPQYRTSGYRQVWVARVERMEALLKERADEGTL
jgi:hypothetical protein